MGWFDKKEDEENEEKIPSLPELPRLPNLPGFPSSKSKSISEPEERLPPLPSLPSNSFGERFSRNAIKEAITGKKEGEEEKKDALETEIQGHSKSFREEIPEGLIEASKKIKRVEPVFIRIDKFEESLEAFEKTKEKLTAIEILLKDIKQTKEQEEKELNSWEREIQIIKEQIEKIDKDIFSKIE